MICMLTRRVHGALARFHARACGRTRAGLSRLRATALITLRAAVIPLVAIGVLVVAMGGTWSVASASPGSVVGPSGATAPPAGSAIAAVPGRPGISDADDHAAHAGPKTLTGKLNLNTATEQQLMLLPSVGPAKADRIVAWRKKNGAFKRTADLRRVKGFGYKTFKRLEPFLDIKGDTTLGAR